jgi:hypothetical protein
MALCVTHLPLTVSCATVRDTLEQTEESRAVKWGRSLCKIRPRVQLPGAKGVCWGGDNVFVFQWDAYLNAYRNSIFNVP